MVFEGTSQRYADSDVFLGEFLSCCFSYYILSKLTFYSYLRKQSILFGTVLLAMDSDVHTTRQSCSIFLITSDFLTFHSSNVHNFFNSPISSNHFSKNRLYQGYSRKNGRALRQSKSMKDMSRKFWENIVKRKCKQNKCNFCDC